MRTTVGVLPLLELDHDPHRLLAVALVDDVGHAGDPSVVDQFGQLLEQRLLGELIGDVGEDDLGAAVLLFLDARTCPQDHPAAAGEIGLLDAHPAADRAAGGEIRARQDLHDLVKVDGRVVDVSDQRVADLAEIVRRD